MLSSRWFQVLRSLGLEFWLPLPLLGLMFWLSSGFVMDRVLQRSTGSVKYLQADTRKQPARTVLSIASITVTINPQLRRSSISIETANSALKALKFEFPVTDPDQVEAAISQELGLPPEQVKSLIRYQIESSAE